MGLSGACNKVVNKTLVCLELRLGGTKNNVLRAMVFDGTMNASILRGPPGD